ncbi:hypothetical protein C8A00DRAFT_30558 [Chaetomidium leptoderma]|uniref:CCHC-type domain-containing protein n=1 Tax=Chaetomidium leptoderma TaxID=669021 RepID=A0AAN6ZYD4_9PEZI|nr:hypothetical protein C8A00DRAFT_30558 [Chaetomidium leptoderma]
MTPADAEELVAVFAEARREYLDRTHRNPAPSPPPANRLMRLIDRWLDATRQADRAPAGAQIPSQQTLVARPAPLENLFVGFGLRDHDRDAPPAAAPITTAASTSHPWPPSHLPPAEARFLNHPRVRDHLAGVSWGDKGKMPNLPGEKSDPLALRLFLGWLGAGPLNVNELPKDVDTAEVRRSYAVFVYIDNIFEGSGKIATIRELLDATTLDKTLAVDVGSGAMLLKKHACIFTRVVVLLATTKDRQTVINSTFEDLRRFGTAVMIRAVERDGAKGVQVAFFCPWDQHPWIKNSWRSYDWRLRLWKEKIIATVDTWAAANKVVVHDGYLGGSITVRKDRDHDSVEMCAGWLLRAVAATKKTIPGDTEEDATRVRQFREKLSQEMRKVIAYQIATPAKDDFAAWVKMAHTLAVNLESEENMRKMGNSYQSGNASGNDSGKQARADDPMGLDAMRINMTRIPQAERERRYNEGLCYNCAQSGHNARDCTNATKTGRGGRGRAGNRGGQQRGGGYNNTPDDFSDFDHRFLT